MKGKVIFLVDMQSFYASIEKADRPELKDKPVVVSGDPERRNGIILAACPVAKKYGVKTAEALWQALQKCPQAVVIKPRMQYYLDVSLAITDILERFTDLVEPYSVDEQFMDVTGSQRLFGDPLTIAKKVQKCIEKETGVYARVGIGPNKLLAKVACDNFAKKNETGIFWLTKENMKTHMWPLPVGKLFGVGSRMNRHLLLMGIHTIGGLANYPLDKLKKRWGINGHVLWMSANGIDYSPVRPDTFQTQKAIGHHMTLPRDYRRQESIKVVLLELCEEVCRRARQHHVMGHTVSVGARGADFDFPTGFHRQATMAYPTNNTADIFKTAWKLFLTFWDREPVRSLGVTLSQLCSDRTFQLNLFEDVEQKLRIGYVMDEIKNRFGPTAIVRASSLTDAGQAFERAKKLGGHSK
ncbi:MAG: DNA polymerase IV [Novibacillus thermophilus]|jgi:DNA polymerase-4|uniref:DNA polymerase IV n=1 Tax=Novibacillus thermophilus TaxID=1471761 RepID=A0A1U9K6W9_9BACL|nr:DNA polymerase IV [Novibacillus thermophilus]AQS55805.1 DNA polymerase IV [Novibacillus thermophilus]